MNLTLSDFVKHKEQLCKERGLSCIFVFSSNRNKWYVDITGGRLHTADQLQLVTDSLKDIQELWRILPQDSTP